MSERANFENPLENLVGYRLRRSSAVMMEDFADTMAPLNLRPTEVSILLLVAANPGCNQSDLGRVLGITRGNMVPLVAGLVARGMILRSPADKRSNALTISSNYVELIEKLEEMVQTHEARFIASLTKRDVSYLFEVLGKISSAQEES